MDSSTSTLKTYIDTQRTNGVSDEVTYNNLVSSGWQHDLVVQALAPQAEVTQTQNGYEQAAVQPASPSQKTIKKVKVIGIITIVLGAISVLAGLLTDMNGLQLLFGAVEILVGVGILLFNRVAYTTFNVIAILAMLSSILMLPGLGVALLLITFSFSIEVLVAVSITIVLSVGQLGFYIYGGIVLHNKEIKSLFSKKL